MFIEISAARAGPKENESRNSGRADDWCRVQKPAASVEILHRKANLHEKGHRRQNGQQR